MGKLDESSFIHSSASRTYPYIKLLKVTDVSPLVIGLLEKGKTPVIAEREGNEFAVASVRLTMKNISMLLRTHKDVMLIGESSEHYIDSCKKFLEVMLQNGFDSVFDD